MPRLEQHKVETRTLHNQGDYDAHHGGRELFGWGQRMPWLSIR